MSAQPLARLRLREATPDDRDAVCALLSAAAGVTGEAHHAPSPLTEPAAHDWLYWNNPFGPPNNVVWEQDGEIVAHAGMYRIQGLVEGKVRRIGRTAHAVTARAFRGKGLFGSLARRQREKLGSEFDLLVSLPTAAAIPGLEGAGVTTRDRAQRWFRPIADRFSDLGRVPRPLARTMARVAFGPLPDAHGERIEGPPEGLDDLAKQAQDDGPLCDATWWRWRFTDNPVHSYRYYETRDRAGRLTAAMATRGERYLGAEFMQVLHWQASDVDAAIGVLGTAMADSPTCLGASLLATEGSHAAEWARRGGLRKLPWLLDDTSGHIAIAAAPGAGGVIPGRHWSISLASHHDR